MNDDRTINLLRKIELFDALTTEELQEIRDKLIIRKFKKNEVILYEEDTNKFMYAILEGKVKILQTTEDGREIIMAMHQAGDSFGEISLIDGKTATASVVATADALIAIVPKRDFYSLLDSSPKFLDSLLQMLCSRIRENVEKIQLLNFNNAAHRVKMLLIKLSTTHGQESQEGMSLTMKLTHQDIANMTGLTRETVTRALDQWQRSGDIRVLDNKCLFLSKGFLEVVGGDNLGSK